MAETRPGLKKHIAVAHPSPADADAGALLRKLPQATCCPLASCRFRSADRAEMESHVARHVAGGAHVAPSPPSKKKVAPLNLQRVRYVYQARVIYRVFPDWNLRITHVLIFFCLKKFEFQILIMMGNKLKEISLEGIVKYYQYSETWLRYESRDWDNFVS